MCADVDQLYAADSKVGPGETPTKVKGAKINLQTPQLWEHRRPANSKSGQSRPWADSSVENLTF